MSCDVVIHKTNGSDIEHLGVNMRDIDILECFLSTGKKPLTVVQDSVQFSLESYTYFYKNELAAIAGIGPHPEDTSIGIPWLLGTDLLSKIPLTLIKDSKQFCNKWIMTYRFSTLTNGVYYENIESQKYLEHLGFQYQGISLDIAFTGEPFYIYTKRGG